MGAMEIARVYGIGYRVRDVTANLAAKFHREPGVPFAVGLLHAKRRRRHEHAQLRALHDH